MPSRPLLAMHDMLMCTLLLIYGNTVQLLSIEN